MGKQLPFWHAVELSAGSRPVLRENEIDVLVEDGVGLYQGKAKIIKRQDGRCYLTSQRIIYIDNHNAKKYSLSVELDDVLSCEYTSKFLKSSPKVIIFFKKAKSSSHNHSSSKASEINWICPICSFSNLVTKDLNFNNQEVLPVCETCGVKASSDLIEETIRNFETKALATTPMVQETQPEQIPCSACTFLNHPSLRNCEICGASLPINEQNLDILNKQEIFDDRIKIEIDASDDLTENNLYIKISFHNKGDKVFFEKLQEVLEQFNWNNLLKKGKVNQSAVSKNNKAVNEERKSLSFGIHSITRREDNRNEKNQEIINSSLDDLDTLLSKADQISQLLDSFKQLKSTDGISTSPFEDAHTDTRILKTINYKDKSKKLYTQEMSRKVSEFLINDGVLEEQGGIITLLDLYAMFNRGRIGENLISPQDLYDFCLEFSSLKLPLVFKQINQLLVIQTNTEKHNLNKVIFQIKSFIEKHGDIDTCNYRFSSILKVSEFFNWSLNIAEEFLQISLELGELAIDKQIFGKHYYLNLFSLDQNQDFDKVSAEKGLIKNVEQPQNEELLIQF